MSLCGVIGTALGERKGKLCITAFVAKMNPDLLKRIPSEIEGHPVVIQETGELRALDARQS